MTEEQRERHAVEIARLEAEQHQETLQRTIALANRLMPATIVGAVFLGLILGADLPVSPAWLCALLVVAVSLAGLTIHHTWLEFMELIRYKYIELYPRLFEVAGHPEWLNYLEFTTPRSLRSWEPGLYLNSLIFLVAGALWCDFLLLPAVADRTPAAILLCILPGVGLGMTIRTAYLVLLAARILERDVKFALGRRWDIGGPFRTTLQLIPYGDGRRFVVPDTIRVEAENGSASYEIPRGFLTDLASVPRFLWPIFPPWERYGPAALLHDYLYTLPEEECSRTEADRTFLRVMKAMGVEGFERSCVYRAVRLFGGSARREAIGRPLLAPDEAERVGQNFRRRSRSLIFDPEPTGSSLSTPPQAID